MTSQPGIDAKVFGIGFHRTGTTSLGHALRQLGYRVTGPDWVTDPEIADKALDLAVEKAKHYDGFQDNPWPILYRELDVHYPGSKFILTMRDTDAWIASVLRTFGTDTTPMRRWIYGYGTPVGHEDVYIERYERHIEEVQAYFQDRQEDLLVMDITEGDGWVKLCSFLNRGLSDIAFPRKNASVDSEPQPDSLRRKLVAIKQRVGRLVRKLAG